MKRITNYAGPGKLRCGNGRAVGAPGIVMYGARRGDDKDRMLAGLLSIVDIPGTQQRDAVLRVVRADPAR